MIGRHGKVYLHFAVDGCGLRALGKLFLERCARTAVGIAVESQHGLGQLAVVHALGQYDCTDKVFVSGCIGQSTGIHAV